MSDWRLQIIPDGEPAPPEYEIYARIAAALERIAAVAEQMLIVGMGDTVGGALLKALQTVKWIEWDSGLYECPWCHRQWWYDDGNVHAPDCLYKVTIDVAKARGEGK